MSIAMTGVTGYGMLGRLIANASVTAARLDTLTNQASTGLIGDTYAGLGTGASVSLDLRPQIANLQTWQNNVDAATGRMAVTQSALTADPVDRRKLLCAAQHRGGRQRRARWTASRPRRATRWGRWRASWIPRTAASTCSPARTPPIRRCPIRTTS